MGEKTKRKLASLRKKGLISEEVYRSNIDDVNERIKQREDEQKNSINKSIDTICNMLFRG